MASVQTLSLLGPTQEPAAAAQVLGAGAAATASGDGKAPTGAGFQQLMAQAVQQQTDPKAPPQDLLNTPPLDPSDLSVADAAAKAVGKALPPSGAQLPDPVAAALAPPPSAQLAGQSTDPSAKTAPSLNDKPKTAHAAKEQDKTDASAQAALLDPAATAPSPGQLPPGIQITPPPSAPAPAGSASADAATTAGVGSAIAATGLMQPATEGADPTAAAIGKAGNGKADASIDAKDADQSADTQVSDFTAQLNKARGADKLADLAGSGVTTGKDSGQTDKADSLDAAALTKQLDATASALNTHSSHAAAASSAANAVTTREYQTTTGTATVTVPVGKPGWSDAVVDKVMWFSSQNINNAEIHLNPPDLGPLQVNISTHHDQASVYFTSQHAAVRDALDQALPKLREMFSSQGLQLTDSGVGGQGAAQQQAQRGQDFGAQSRANSSANAEPDIAISAATRGAPARVSVSLVDAYA